MKKVDKLIDTLSEHIMTRIENNDFLEEEIAVQTKALAELLSARAKVPYCLLLVALPIVSITVLKKVVTSFAASVASSQ